MIPRFIWCLAMALFAVPVVLAMAASALLITAGGFGAGHGPADKPIYLLGLPATDVLESLPVPRFVEQSDLLLVIWYPALLNLIVLWGPLAGLLLGLARIRAGRRPQRDHRATEETT